jgi:hypothetical protein
MALKMRERAHREATQLTLAQVAERLQDILGQELPAYAIGVKDPRIIGKYARGKVKTPARATEARLRQLYVITQILMTRETAETVRAWMIGAHPLLEDRAPIELLHEEKYEPVERTAQAESPSPAYRSVVEAAEVFAGSA